MLPKKKNVSLTIHAGTKAIDVRREMAKAPAIVKSLNKIDRAIFSASTKTSIEDCDEKEIIPSFSKLLLYVAKDTGYNIPHDKNEWLYTETRIYNIVKTYYSDLSLSEIRVAFELLCVGELDEFLPKDQFGNADRKHYQQFNADYISKVLNAYRKRRTLTMKKAYAVVPADEKKVSDEEIEVYKNDTKQVVKEKYHQYLKEGRYTASAIEEMIIYKRLKHCGYAGKIDVTDECREKAMALYTQRAIMGFVSKYDVALVKKNGTDSEELNLDAFIVGMRKEIKNGFDKMRKEGIR